jgi:hypothetical protein
VNITTTARNADLPSIIEILRGQRALRHDLVVPAPFIRAEGGRLTVEGDTEVTVMDEDGVDVRPVAYSVTGVAEEGISEKLGIPRAYLRRMRSEHPDLWDANVNGWLQHPSRTDAKYLLRTLRDEETGQGVARALLTNGYKPMESLDVLVAAMEGIRDAGAAVELDRADLTERRLYVTMHCPEVAAMAPGLLDGYRGPWHQRGLAEQRVPRVGQDGSLGNEVGRWLGVAEREGMAYPAGQEPIVFAGFELSNSDTGSGAFTLSPKLLVRICRNGLTLDIGRVRKVHLGARLEEGAIDWSSRTHEAALVLIKEQTRDAVKRFLDVEFLREAITTLEQSAGVPVSNPAEAIKHVTKALSYSDERADAVLAHFIAGGQLTAGGVMQAVTSVAQTVVDGDEAARMEADAVRALDLAAAFAVR